MVLVPGILLLVPGSIGYRSMSSLMERDTVAGIATAFTMVLTAVSLVAGLLIAGVLAPEPKLSTTPRQLGRAVARLRRIAGSIGVPNDGTRILNGDDGKGRRSRRDDLSAEPKDLGRGWRDSLHVSPDRESDPRHPRSVSALRSSRVTRHAPDPC